MSDDLHPLTEKLLDHIDNDGLDITSQDFDAIVREGLAPSVTVGSGVRFPETPDIPVEIAGNFVTSGNQMQMLMVGTEPVLVVQPEYDAEEGVVTLITTTVDLPPAGLVQVLEALLDGARTIVGIQRGDEPTEYDNDIALRSAGS